MSTSAACIWATALLFGLSHSLLANQFCRSRARACGITPGAYRLFYSVLASVLTILWVWLVHSLNDAPLYAVHGISSLPLYVLQLAGLIIFLFSLCAFDAAIFLGFRPMPEGGEPFVERGIYRHLRHPMYSGCMLILLASPVQSVNSLHFSLSVCLYFVIGSWFEERRMQALHPAYGDYRRHVPAFIPRASLFRKPAASQ